MDISSTFLEQGYVIAPANHMEPLYKLRNEIFSKATEIFGHAGDEPAAFFNNFHSLEITGTKLNTLRMQLIQRCTQEVDSGTMIFDAFCGTITELLGPDLLVQKNTNLVIQQPNDPNPSEVHRDSPANSPYEVVVWLPLVDCYKSKGMYICSRKVTQEGLALLDKGSDDWTEFERFCVEKGTEPDVPFGTALFFWPGLFHGSRINAEKETRWSLNMRYKNLFSPGGLKEPFEFFNIFRLSSLAKMAIEFERTQSLR